MEIERYKFHKNVYAIDIKTNLGRTTFPLIVIITEVYRTGGHGDIVHCVPDNKSYNMSTQKFSFKARCRLKIKEV